MGNIFEESLFSKQPKQFEKIDSQAKAFAANYCGSTIIRDSIFGIVANYARKRELSLEILRYPGKMHKKLFKICAICLLQKICFYDIIHNVRR